MRRPRKKAPTLLTLPHRGEVEAAFMAQAGHDALLAIEYERVEQMFGFVRQLSAFVLKPRPMKGDFRIEVEIPDGLDAETLREVLLDAGDQLGQHARIHRRLMAEDHERRKPKEKPNVPDAGRLHHA